MDPRKPSEVDNKETTILFCRYHQSTVASSKNVSKPGFIDQEQDIHYGLMPDGSHENTRKLGLLKPRL